MLKIIALLLVALGTTNAFLSNNFNSQFSQHLARKSYYPPSVSGNWPRDNAVHHKPLPALGSIITGVSSIPGPVKVVALLAALFTALKSWADKALWTPSRTYSKEANSVGKEYDAWEEEGILEYYWGEHIHLGYYGEKERAASQLLPPPKNFIQAKYDFIDEMLKFGQFDVSSKPLQILDVGCGIGGTSRYLAKKFGQDTTVVGITLSQNQVNRATALAKEQDVPNARFEVMDALDMTFPDNSFDYVWACESGEHMPDKKKYVEQMTRVLKPGGRIVIATWCQRDEGNKPFTDEEKRMLNFLYSEWTHPFFISISDYKKLMDGTGQLEDLATDDWTPQTIASWLHSIWVGVFDPWPVFSKPKLWWKTFRDGLTLVRMHKSFNSKLMEYGMMTGTKKQVATE
mmetsp:Transcript_21875/g.36606  ORF Transcript_21875/g.36606 Transcript_21875/m.36606 type:complete len:401 (+) Transcript_21875:105-1307(+)|eukprot:CAMPEP_0174960874 /NCGR_PEP_ID=MMETSP0004_2-20121128/3933_1 /TAXON_ID=420556 /ORGANISM="Ochromonas sp., Strain CCMP1393" /LENGTH=400 /DNA_ID=CAMNT_0016209269 /DNA_START=89 /DNA_END=1291 /DNA_ORIENTATION=+